MKKFTLVLLTLLTLSPFGAWAEEVKLEGVTYSYEGTTATVQSVDNSVTTVKITLLAEFLVENTLYTVTGIDQNAFYDCAKLKTIIIPNATLLNALNDVTLTSLPTGCCFIYGGIKYYHRGSSWKNGDHFAVGNGDKGAGYNDSLDETLSIQPSIGGIGVTEISNHAFSGVCKKINIPSSVITITNLSFINNNLISINVDAESSNFKSIDGVLFSKDGKKLISYPISKSASYTIPDGVETIDNDAFNSSKLSSVTIPASVRTINQGAFQYTGKTATGGFVVTISSGSKLETIGGSVFQETGLSFINLPEGLKTIGEKAFNDCPNLTSITIPYTLTAIASNAFWGCKKLANIIFDTSKTYNNTTIGSNAFFNCKLAATIEIPKGVTSIGSYAFNVNDDFDDSALQNIYIPSSVTSYNETAVASNVAIYREVNLNIGTETWATYYSTLDLALPSNLKAYTITGVNSDNSLQLTPLHYIHKERAVLLEHTDSNPVTTWFTQPSGETIAQDATIAFNTALFKGTTKGISDVSTLKGDKYVLSGDQFVKTHQGSLPAFRCYIVTNSDNPASNLYIKDSRDNTIIIQEEGSLVNKNVTTIGSATLSAPTDGKITITVTPGANFYAEKDNITVIKNVAATVGRAPSVDNTAITVTALNAAADPSGVTTYTFPYTDGSTYEVTVNFQKRINFQTTTTKTKITLATTGYEYDGQEKKPEIASVTYSDNNTVVDPVNYEKSYIDNINAGTGKVHITGKRKFMGEYDATFSISQRAITNANVIVTAIPAKTYTGSAIEPVPTITDNVSGENIISSEDYTLTYQNNVNAGDAAKVVITANSKNYTGVRDVTFTINRKDLSLPANKPTITPIPDQQATGSPIEPAVEVKDGDRIIPANNYTVAYSDNTGEGTATVTLTFTGVEGANYSGTATTTFKIVSTITTYLECWF